MKSIFKHTPFAIALLILLLIKLTSLSVNNDMWWDSSVYIGMGKYMYSFGNSGLWEPSRPIIWPLILGFFWKIGIDPILAGKFVVILASIGCSLLTYLIANKLFNRKIAFISSILLGLSPTFFLFTNILLTEIISTFFLLLGIYFLFEKRNIPAGFFLGVSFMTRFFQIFTIIPIFLVIVYKFYKRNYKLEPLFVFFASFLTPIVLFLMFNAHMYKNALYPFILQIFMTKYTGWIYNQPLGFYFINLLKENFITVFSIIGAIILLKDRNIEKKSIALMFLTPLVLYALSKHKEMRFLIVVFPFLYILAGFGTLYFANLFRYNKNLVLALILIVSAVQISKQLRVDNYEDSLQPFYSYAATLKNDTELWISNPSFVLFSDKKAYELIYYPLYNSAKAKELLLSANKAEAVMFNSCDVLPCPPDDDKCLQETQKLFDFFNKNLMLVHNQKINSCEYSIFHK